MAKAAVAKKKDWTITQNNIADKEKALKTALAGIDKKFGTMAVMRLGECKNMNIESIPTGLFTLDLALGIGGLPKGRIAEIYGPESSGKTTVALLNIAEAQKKGGICAFIDAEHALDPEYAKRLGVDLDNLYISQPDNGEQALEIAEQLASSGAIDTLVVDSVAALVPKAEIDGEMGDSHVGLQARLMSQGLRKLASIISRSQTVFIFINQLREKIGNNYGSSETTTGGRALKFYASVRLDIRKQSSIKGGKEGKEILGYHTSIKVVKNKVAPPFKATIIDMIPGTGFDNIGAIVNLAIKRDVIQKSGSWYTYQKNKAQGIPGIRQFFVDHPELLEAIKEELSKQPYNNEEIPPVDESIKKEKSPYDASNIEKQDNDDASIGNSEDDYFDFDDLMVIKPDQTE